jgi:WD40 repeat protein
MAFNFSQPLDSETLAERLAGAAAFSPATEPALLRFVARHWGSGYQAQPARLPSGLEPDEAAAITAALAASLHATTTSPPTAATFRPENIRLQQTLTGWQVTLAPPGPDSGPPLDQTKTQAAFAGLLYRLTTGQEFGLDPSARTSQLARLRNTNSYLAVVLEEALDGHFNSPGALAGGFGWSLYRKSHLNAAPPPPPRQHHSRHPAPVNIMQIPASTLDSPAYNRAWGGPLALVSLGVAMVLLAGTVLFSISGLDKEYRQQSLAASRTPTRAQPLAPTATPVVALQISRQADGASLTRYNPAFDQVSGQYTDPTRITAGAAIPLNDFRSLQVQDAHWSADGQQVGLALKDGGWENWDVTTRQRLARKELPNADQYQFVSWSPDGQNFAGLGLDGQLRLGKGDRVLRTVSFKNGQGISRGSGSDWPFSWSPDSVYLLINLNNLALQLWDFQNLPVQVEPVRDDTGKTRPTPVLDALTGGSFTGFAWSPDGKSIARVLPGLNEQQIAVYSLGNLARQYVIKVPLAPLTGSDGKSRITGYVDYNAGLARLAWSPDGRYMALMRGITPTTPDTASGFQNIAQLTVFELPVQPVSNDATPSSSSAAFDASPTVAPSSFETWPFQPLSSPYRPQEQVLSWSSDNRLLVTGVKDYAGPVADQPTLPANQAMTLELKPVGNTLRWQPGGPYTLPFQDKPDYAAWGPDNRHILFNSGSSGLGVSALPGQAGADLPTDLWHKETTTGYALYLPSPDGHNFLVYQTGGNPLVRDSATGQLVAELAKPASQQSTIGQPKWSPDGLYLAIPYLVPVSQLNQTLINEETIRAWKFEAGQAPVLAGDLLVPGSSDNYQNSSLEWDIRDGQPSLLFNFGVNGIGRWDVTRPLPSLNYQRLESNQQTAASVITNNASPYFQVAGRLSLWNSGGKQVWFPDHKHLLSYNNGTIFIQDLIPADAEFDLAKEKGTPLVPQPPFDVNQASPNLMVSPDGRMVAVGLPNGLLTLYDAQTGKLFNSFTAHINAILGLNFSPDGRYLATSSRDRLVKIWDTTSWRSLAVLRLTGTDAGNLAWLPDNKTLAVTSGYQDGTLLWRALA